VGDWRPTGSHLPQRVVEEALHAYIRALFRLFEADRNDSLGATAA
jgi:hypothetical protein